MQIYVYQTPDDASAEVAKLVAQGIRDAQEQGRSYVLGLATGSTPKPFYKELVRMHRDQGLSFSNVITFNLDEYYGLQRDDPQSYWWFMHDQLFDHVDLLPCNIHLPTGTVPLHGVEEHCAAYERAISEAGGIDLQILGVGRIGHIGFNESPSPLGSVTRLVDLHPVTRDDAAGDFGGLGRVPLQAITMGVRTIIESRRVVLMAWGEGKAPTVAAAFQGPVTEQVPASFLQRHPDAAVYLDPGAAAGLDKAPVTRVGCCATAIPTGSGGSTSSGHRPMAWSAGGTIMQQRQRLLPARGLCYRRLQGFKGAFGSTHAAAQGRCMTAWQRRLFRV